MVILIGAITMQYSDYTMSLIGNGFDAITTKTSNRIREVNGLLSDAQDEHNRYLCKTEEMLQEMGLQPIKFNDGRTTYHLYCLTKEAEEYFNRLKSSAGSTYDAMYTLVKHPGMFIVVELTESYVDYYQAMTNIY